MRIFLATVFIWFAAPVALAQERTIDAVIEDVIDEAIRPAFARLHTEAETMVQTTAALCASPSDASMRAARRQFGGLVRAWGRAEFMRLGPLSQDNRLERILFWPDRRGRGLTQIQGVIATSDETALSPATLAGKSVAVQGLVALEYALHGTGSEQIEAGEATLRCKYAEAISHNIAALAAEVQSGWESKDDIASLWLNPSADNPLFRDEAEQINGLIKMIGDAIEIIKVQRLAPVLGEEIASMQPRSALFWRSGNWVASLSANISGLQVLLQAARLKDTTDSEGRIAIGAVEFELANAARALAATDKPPSLVASDEEAWKRLNYVDIVLESLIRITGTQLPAVYDLSAGFSSLDGD